MEEVKYHVEGFKDARNHKDRMKHIIALKRISTSESLEKFLKLGLGNHKNDIVAETMLNLIRQGPSAIPLLAVHGLKSNDAQVNALSHYIVSELGVVEALKPLVNYGLTHKDLEVAINAASTISSLVSKLEIQRNSHKYLNKLVTLTTVRETRNKALVSQAESLMEKMMGPIEKDIINNGLTHENDKVRYYSLLTMSKLNKKRAVTNIIKHCLKSDDKFVLITSMDILKEFPRHSALPKLMRITGHKYEGVREKAKETIRIIQEAERAKH